MKIAVVDNLPEGGAKRVVYEQIKGLSHNHQIDYYTNKISSSYPFDKFVDNLYRFDLALPDLSGTAADSARNTFIYSFYSGLPEDGRGHKFEWG
jgi:hypothetical protein